jgi:hypothetical protein
MRHDDRSLCAVKSIPKTSRGIAKEIAILRKIQHRNIVTLQAVYESQDTVDLVFDLHEDPDLLK